MNKEILFLCGRELEYQRNQVLYKAFIANNYNVTVLRPGHETKSILGRSMRVGIQSANILTRRKFDVIFVGFYGYLLSHIAKSFSNSPILFDPFVSNYETLVEDRKVSSKNSIFAWFYSTIDKSALRLAKHNISDTNRHIDFYCRTYQMDQHLFSRIFVGCDESIFSSPKHFVEEEFVLFYGSYQPLHGIPNIISAAKLIKNKKIKFLIIGDGKGKSELIKYAKEIGTNNVCFRPSVKLSELPQLISKSRICLGGPFGSSEKGKRVITGKTFQSLAMGKATIVGDNPANHELLQHNKDAWFCELNNPQSLANSIDHLLENSKLRQSIGECAKLTFIEKASSLVIKDQIKEIIEAIS